jgi:transposase InsO family protein
MSLRREFVELALQPGANRRQLCQRFEISPKTGYKWLERFEAHGASGLEDRSRRPLRSPLRAPEAVEAAVLDLRAQHPAWGGRKIARRLQALGKVTALAPSTATRILKRHGLIAPDAARGDHRAYQRFEHVAPNALWQIDFKGYFETPVGRCHPLTLLDDHSRYNLALQACARTDALSIQPVLTQVFRRYGLPVRINADNGAPWGAPREPSHGLSQLSVWLIRLGIRISHSRPAHPQTNGKDERFHRSLQAVVLNGRSFDDLQAVQRAFECWRVVYNHERPHEALQDCPPIKRYRPSERPYPEQLPAIEYGPDDTVLTVDWNGWVRFAGHRFKVSSALHRLPIALRPIPQTDGLFDGYFCHQRFMRLDLRQPLTKQ